MSDARSDDDEPQGTAEIALEVAELLMVIRKAQDIGATIILTAAMVAFVTRIDHPDRDITLRRLAFFHKVVTEVVIADLECDEEDEADPDGSALDRGDA